MRRRRCRRRSHPSPPRGRCCAHCRARVLRRADQADREFSCDRRRVVGGAVVDDDHLVVRVLEGPDARRGNRGGFSTRCSVQTTTDMRGRSSPARTGPPRTPSAPHRGLAWLLRSRSDETEIPVLDLASRRGATRRSTRRRTFPRILQRRRVPTCQARLFACSSSPWRRLSSPISLITRGRSPARFCRCARYASKSLSDSRKTLKQSRSRNGESQVLGRRIIRRMSPVFRDPRASPCHRACEGAARTFPGLASGRAATGARCRGCRRGRPGDQHMPRPRVG